MKVILVLIAALFSLPILLIAGLQLMRLIIIEFADLVIKAWRGPETRPSS